jgi:leucyl-tRNA synthetase
MPACGLWPVAEPFKRLRNQGMLLDASDGKMSKSRPQHVVTPDAAVAGHGADAVLPCLMAPIMPHLAEELWQRRGHAESVHRASWPVADPALAAVEKVEVVL